MQQSDASVDYQKTMSVLPPKCLTPKQTTIPKYKQVERDGRHIQCLPSLFSSRFSQGFFATSRFSSKAKVPKPLRFQDFLELLGRFELPTSSLPTTVEPSSPCCIRLCSVFLSKKDEVAACLFHYSRPLISPCGSRCGSNRFQDANEGRTSDSGKPSRCALSRS